MECRNTKANQRSKIAHVPSPTVEEEVENVEYLDECATNDIVEANGNAHNSPPRKVVKTETTLEEDTFYPNAVHCLISLYRDKYETNMNDPQEMQNLCENVWEDISKDMRECYFEFDVQQVRKKFTELRRQYFSVSSKKEAKEFVYFQPLNEIYNDKLVLNAINNEKLSVTAHKNNRSRIYRDDVLFDLHIETNKRAIDKGPKHREEVTVDTHNRHIDCKNESIVTNFKRERSESKESPVSNLRCSKRKFLNMNSKEIPLDIKHEDIEQKTVNCKDKNVDMTLADYNEAQQQRHEEKMSLLKQTILLQERALDIQNKLLEELISRVK